jgi:protein arginine N-methyltransferase 1
MDQRLLLMHQMMLADRPRLRAYDRALEQAVGPGDVVADVGSGTLALSLLALRHGAEHVYAVEADPQLAEVAAGIVRANDLKGRITLVEGDARVARLPSRCDVVVSELMGNLGPEEGMLPALSAFARRNLRPGGVLVPARLRTFLQAVEFDAEGWGIWDADFFGYRLDPVLDAAEPQAQLHFFQQPPRLLSEPVAVYDVRAGEKETAWPPTAATRLPIVADGTLHAIIGYFTADLAVGTSLANFPSYPGCNWAVWVWPLRHTRVGPGDEVEALLRSPGRGPATRVATEWRLDCGIARAQGRP